jgi:hypothetical protein
MKIVYRNEELGNFIAYDLAGNNLTLGDELTVALDRYERDNAAHYDVCFDRYGCLVMGVIPGVADRYAAQIDIPARQYVDEETGDTDEETDEPVTVLIPVPFDPDNLTLTLWGQEEN